MAPNTVTQTIFEKPSESPVDLKPAAADKSADASLIETIKSYTVHWLHRKDVKWHNVVLIFTFNFAAIYGFICFPYLQHWKTFLVALFWGLSAAFGITGGAHRFWTHRSYKANAPMRLVLAFCYLAAGQNSIYQWVRDHRLHHKFSETDADPHNSNRGFFFSHVGWLMLHKHPEVLRKGKQIDMSDIDNDPIANFCNKHFVILKTLICFVIPIALPVYLWDEELKWAIVPQISRYIYVLHVTWSVNSFAHLWGNRPYDSHIAPVENAFVSYVTFGEGWHNYHHVFPSDYRAAEIGGGRFNTTTTLIDFFAKLGWVKDRKYPSDKLIQMTVANRGDGTHEHAEEIAQMYQKKM